MEKMNKKRKAQRGISLIELMIAMLLSLIIISGVVALVSQLRNNANLLSAEAELQENLSFASNRLGFAIKSAFSSPCGDLTEMLSQGGSGTSGLLKRAYTFSSSTVTPQPMAKLIMGTTPAPYQTTIRHQDFPMFTPGIVGDNEPTITSTGGASVAISSLLDSPRAGSNYIAVMEISERVLLNTGSARGVRGGISAVPAGHTTNNPQITTSDLPDRLVGQTGVPFIITDCHQGDLFKSSDSVALMKNRITVDDNLYFSGAANGYHDAESVVAPLNVYVYYLRNDVANNSIGLARKNLMNDDDEMLVQGVTDWQLSWGLASTEELAVQAYFTNKQIVDAQMPIADFRRQLISVRSNLTMQGHDEKYRDLSLNMQRAYTIRNKMQRK